MRLEKLLLVKAIHPDAPRFLYILTDDGDVLPDETDKVFFTAAGSAKARRRRQPTAHRSP
jgi:hypothetical protein